MPHKDPEAAKASKRAYYLAHKDVWREKGRKWKEAHREEIAGASRRYYAANKDKHAAAVKSWVKRNPEKKRKSVDAYQERNREQFLENSRRAARMRWANDPTVKQAAVNRRRAAKMAAPGDGVTKEQWRETREYFGQRCAYCLRPGRLTQDHIDPLVRGGAHDVDNVVPACRSCNSSKGDKTFLMWLLARPRNLFKFNHLD